MRDRILLAVSIHSYGKDIYYPKVFKAIIVHTICICCAIIIFAIQMKKDNHYLAVTLKAAIADISH